MSRRRSLAAPPAFLVKDLTSVPSFQYTPPVIGEGTAVGGIVYFLMDDGVHGRELWRSDGTETGVACTLGNGLMEIRLTD